MTTYNTRFAPSPTGYLHLGHAFSAIIASKLAEKSSGNFYLRIEDIDLGRSKINYEETIYEDLEWLGLEYENLPVTVPPPTPLIGLISACILPLY